MTCIRVEHSHTDDDETYLTKAEQMVRVLLAVAERSACHGPDFSQLCREAGERP